MPEQRGPRRPGGTTAPRLSGRATAGLLLALVAIFCACLALAPRGDAAEGEAFGGTDSAAVETLERDGVEPWFTPVFSPGSGEVESGLFALQAALGGGVFGYAVGALRGRSLQGRQLEAQDS